MLTLRVLGPAHCYPVDGACRKGEGQNAQHCEPEREPSRAGEEEAKEAPVEEGAVAAADV